MATLWPYIAAFLSPVLGFLSAYLVVRINRQHASGLTSAQGEAAWRQARLDAEQALREDLRKETAARIQWQLENDGDLERIAGILRDVNDTNKLTATLAATSQHHNRELERINTRVEGIGKQLSDFILSHVRPT